MSASSGLSLSRGSLPLVGNSEGTPIFVLFSSSSFYFNPRLSSSPDSVETQSFMRTSFTDRKAGLGDVGPSSSFSDDAFDDLGPEEIITDAQPPPQLTEDTKIGSDAKIGKVLASRKEVDRSDWASRLRSQHPDIADLQDRVSPVGRTVAFGQAYIPKRDQIQATIPKQTVIQLVLQHLQSEGLKSSRIELEQAMGQKLNPALLDMQESRLVSIFNTEQELHPLDIMRIGLKEVERVWDLSMRTNHVVVNVDVADKYGDDEELEEQLYELGLLEEDPESSEDTNYIWEEPEEDNIIWYTPPNGTKPVIKAATLNKLVEQLTQEKDYDVEFQRAFLMTYQSFTTPERLLQKLMQRFQVPEKRLGSNEPEIRSSTNTIQVRAVGILKKWLDLHWGDLNEQQSENFKSFLEKRIVTYLFFAYVPDIKSANERLYAQVQSTLQKKNYEDKKERVFKELPPEPKVSNTTIFSPSLSLVDIDEVEIARQMTILEFELFSKIKSSELLNQAWNKPKLRHRAQNVLALINRSTEVSSWVASCIVKESKLKNRAKVMSRFIKIAEHLRKLNNFSSLMAVVAGMNNSAVFRLRYTREEVSRQYRDTYEYLMAQVSSSNGYRTYRDTLATLQPPCIPYLGVYLTGNDAIAVVVGKQKKLKIPLEFSISFATLQPLRYCSNMVDLTFMDDGSPNFLPSPKEGKDLINFAKRRLIAVVLAQVQQFQLQSYNLQPVHQILTLLKTDRLRQQKLEDKEIWKLSLIHEPRDADKASLE